MLHDKSSTGENWKIYKSGSFFVSRILFQRVHVSIDVQIERIKKKKKKTRLLSK